MHVFSRALLLAAIGCGGAAQAQTPWPPEAQRNPTPGQMLGQAPQAPGPQPGFTQQDGPQGGMPQGMSPQGMPPAQAASPVLPPMSLMRQFAGPLPETAIQRFVDPETGVLCYLYTPYRVPHERNESGVLIYGPNNIGSISCVAPGRAATAESLSALPAAPGIAPGIAPAAAAQGGAANTAGGASNGRSAAAAPKSGTSSRSTKGR